MKRPTTTRSVSPRLDRLERRLTEERNDRMNENLTTREALDTLNQKLTDAQSRDKAKNAAFGTFAKNVLHKLDGLAKQADDPAVPALTADDLAEIRQMMTTADGIGLVGLADFGVTPTGDHLPAPPPAAPAEATPAEATPVQTQDGHPVMTADGQAVVAAPPPPDGAAPQEPAPATSPAPQEVQSPAPDSAAPESR